MPLLSGICQYFLLAKPNVYRASQISIGPVLSPGIIKKSCNFSIMKRKKHLAEPAIFPRQLKGI